MSPKRKVSPVGAVRHRRRAPAEQRLDAREQFRHLERLDEVVVGAELQADDAIHDLAARRQHQDRRLDAALPQRPADVEAAAAWQHDVEQDDVEWPRRAARQSR